MSVECKFQRPVFKLCCGLCVRGPGRDSESSFIIEDLGPRADRGAAVVLPNSGDIKSQFLGRGVKSRSRESVGEVPDFPGCSFQDGVHFRHCGRGEGHEAMCVVDFRMGPVL